MRPSPGLLSTTSLTRHCLLPYPSPTQGNAKIAGMQHDLALSDDAYAWVLSIFFFGYLICEVPSNMILSRSKPSVFLPSIMLVWGVVSALMSVSRNYASLLAFRFVLGCLESGFFPGVLYLLSCWYTKEELGTLTSAFIALFPIFSFLEAIIPPLLSMGT